MLFIIDILIFILGASIGSFLSVIIFRLRKKQKGILIGRSMCQHCKKNLTAFDLIPIFSYVISKGKCRYCQKKLTPHYLFLEIVGGLLFLLVYLKFSFVLGNSTFANYQIDLTLLFQCLIYWLYSIFFIGIFFYDLQYMEIPDIFLFPFIIITLLGALFFKIELISLLIALGIAFVFFGGQILLSRGTWLGEGDLYLAISMAFIFGWKLFLVAIILTYIIGASLSILLMITKKAGRKSKIAFAPFMVIGSFATIFFGQPLLDWYLKLLSL